MVWVLSHGRIYIYSESHKTQIFTTSNRPMPRNRPLQSLLNWIQIYENIFNDIFRIKIRLSLTSIYQLIAKDINFNFSKFWLVSSLEFSKYKLIEIKKKVENIAQFKIWNHNKILWINNDHFVVRCVVPASVRRNFYLRSDPDLCCVRSCST